MRHALPLILSLLASHAVAACPGPTDMAKGVEVKTVSPRGEGNTFVYRRTGPGQIDQSRTSQWMSISNTVETRLAHGLVPLESIVTKADTGSPLKDVTYTYPDQDIRALAITPNTSFTLAAKSVAADGFKKETTTTYTVGRLQKQRIAGCMLDTVEIIAVQDWDGIETTITYLYFPRMGFALELERRNPGKTFSKEIMQISASAR